MSRLLDKKKIQLEGVIREWTTTRDCLRKIRDDIQDSEREPDRLALQLMKKRDQIESEN